MFIRGLEQKISTAGGIEVPHGSWLICLYIQVFQVKFH
jgi:hypothetical protein